MAHHVEQATFFQLKPDKKFMYQVSISSVFRFDHRKRTFMLTNCRLKRCSLPEKAPETGRKKRRLLTAAQLLR